MSHPLPKRKLLLLGAAAATSAVAGGMISPGLGAAMGGLLSGVLGNYFATITQDKVHSDPGPSSEEVIKNHDLRRLVGEAIRETILLGTIDSTIAKPLAGKVMDLWMDESAAADPLFGKLSEQEVVELFGTDEISFDQKTSLEVGTWRIFLEELAEMAGVEPADSWVGPLAESLHKNLPRMLRGIVKKDFTGDTASQGRGYASLELALLGQIAAGIDRLLKREKLSEELLEQLKLVNDNLPQVAGKQYARITDKVERAGLGRVIEQINQLRPHIDKRLNELLRAVHEEGEMTRHEVREVGGKVDDVQATVDKIYKELQQQKINNPNAPTTVSEEDRKILEAIKHNGNAIQQARAAALLGEIDQARELFSQIDEKSATEQAFNYYRTKGDIEYFDGQYDKSIEPYDKASRMRPDDLVAHFSLANAHLGARLGDVALHKKQAIAIYEELLKRFPAGSTEWATTQHNLGAAWSDFPTGDKTENLNKAIACYKAALEVWTKEAYPADWARIQNNLGHAWSTFPTGDKAENLQKAIACCESALEVHTKEAYPADWARIQINLGNAWHLLPNGDENKNLKKAIACYKAALEVYTKEAYPADWAATQSNLGVAWGTLATLPTSDKTGNLKNAMACFKAAQEFFTKEAYPDVWKKIQTIIDAIEGELRELK